MKIRPILALVVWLRVALSVLLVVAVVTGCGLSRLTATRYAPTVAGVVTTRDLSSRPYRFRLDDGTTVEIDRERPMIDHVTPEVGDLLILGETPRPWAASAQGPGAGQGQPAGCFRLSGPAYDEGEFLDIELQVDLATAYIRVPKAPSWAGAWSQGESIPAARVCLDDMGRAFDVILRTFQ